MRLLLNWVLSAFALMIVAFLVPGFAVDNFGYALLAAVIVGLINATIGVFLKIITFPLTVLTLGIFWLIINALMLLLASAITPGFHVAGFLPAFLGGIVLSLLNLAFRSLTTERRPA